MGYLSICTLPFTQIGNHKATQIFCVCVDSAPLEVLRPEDLSAGIRQNSGDLSVPQKPNRPTSDQTGLFQT